MPPPPPLLEPSTARPLPQYPLIRCCMSWDNIWTIFFPAILGLNFEKLIELFFDVCAGLCASWYKQVQNNWCKSLYFNIHNYFLIIIYEAVFITWTSEEIKVHSVWKHLQKKMILMWTFSLVSFQPIKVHLQWPKETSLSDGGDSRKSNLLFTSNSASCRMSTHLWLVCK